MKMSSDHADCAQTRTFLAQLHHGVNTFTENIRNVLKSDIVNSECCRCFFLRFLKLELYKLKASRLERGRTL